MQAFRWESCACIKQTGIPTPQGTTTTTTNQRTRPRQSQKTEQSTSTNIEKKRKILSFSSIKILRGYTRKIHIILPKKRRIYQHLTTNTKSLTKLRQGKARFPRWRTAEDSEKKTTSCFSWKMDAATQPNTFFTAWFFFISIFPAAIWARNSLVRHFGKTSLPILYYFRSWLGLYFKVVLLLLANFGGSCFL